MFIFNFQNYSFLAVKTFSWLWGFFQSIRHWNIPLCISLSFFYPSLFFFFFFFSQLSCCCLLTACVRLAVFFSTRCWLDVYLNPLSAWKHQHFPLHLLTHILKMTKVRIVTGFGRKLSERKRIINFSYELKVKRKEGKFRLEWGINKIDGWE